ncbi:DUF3144 domain-containing protein [Acinetobacter nectaris]|uniref:DUF3144 domain-containing protein n=1 Tax=Acinetobacter nectaris TaxID=1219382 RepID=UPI001F1C5BA4|nr:DUF3144 domain-containing protein [Acinetobacter nectaris]MCF8998884.1 DUF3144 domain-containing protein [Acinetobacter nectaris]MCF9027523.1 DUF3144 domain-containing protein [Acinetobacter nectaris]
MTQKINATDITEDEALNAAFFERADEFIKIANDFCHPDKKKISESPAQIRSEVSASLLFASARFNTWVASNTFQNSEEMRKSKDDVISYLMQQFQMMLEDNFDEYCEQFESYLRFRKNEEFHHHKHE